MAGLARQMDDMKSTTHVFLLVALITALCSSQALADQTPKVEFNQYFTYSQYSTGEASHITSSFLLFHFPNESKLWYGYQSTVYIEPPRPFGFGKFKEDYNTVGGYFTYKNRLSYQFDCFRMTNQLGDLTTIYGGELIHRVGKNLAAGAAYYYTSNPRFTMKQYNARLYYAPSKKLSFNTKLYVNDSSSIDPRSSDSRSGTAVQERINWQMSPSVSLQLRGAVGRRINAVDNDISSVYTQYAVLLSSCGAFMTCRLNDESSLVLGYNRDVFDGYSVDGFQGGLKLYF